MNDPRDGGMPDETYRVLIIDDDADVALYTSTILQRRGGCIVRALGDPLRAAEVAAEFKPDVVVTDIEMPGMSGLELIAQLRASQPLLPVVVMTAHISLDYAVRALRSQADEFLTKPVVSTELVSIVHRLGAKFRRAMEGENELDRAAEVQRSLLPKQLVSLPGYQLAGGCAPAKAVGGDFFDWYAIGGGAAFSLADVMGKGIGAAIIAATVRAVLRSHSHADDLATAVTNSALALEADLDQAGTFVTLFHSRLDAATGELRYVDAGHGLSLLVRANGGVKRLATTSLPLGSGLGDGWREHSVSLEPGDTLIAMSDGVLDLYDGTLASLDEVEKLARALPDAQSIVDALVAQAGHGAEDDVTAVVLRRAR